MASATLSGTTAIVTGAASGLGRAIAQAYLAAGANVAICDISKDRLAAAKSEWGSAHGDKFIALEADISDESSVTKLLADTVAKFGALNVLVNNAGIMDKFDPAGSCSKETWDRILAVNLTGSFLTTKAAINQFEKQEGEGKGGIIINIGSNASFYGFCAGVAYTASKFGVMALTKNTAGCYGSKGIYSMALLLGGMNTNITDAFATGVNKEGMQMMAAGFNEDKIVPIEDVAKYVVFLSDRGIAASANGSCITFNKNWPAA